MTNPGKVGAVLDAITVTVGVLCLSGGVALELGAGLGLATFGALLLAAEAWSSWRR